MTQTQQTQGPAVPFGTPLNPTQMRTFNELLAIGGERPYMPAGLLDTLRAKLDDGTRDARNAWTERSLWLSKSGLFSVLRCEGAFKADRETSSGPYRMHPSTAAGTVAHRAIQMSHTHPGHPAEDVVRSAVVGARADEKFNTFWEAADLSTQSDVMVQATSRTMGFLDAWPPMHASWAPRLEEPISAKIGTLSLSGRVDLLLGRPRADGKQTMMIVDWKSGNLNDYHLDEARFYALVAALRFGVAPFRSTIYSLASGTWTDPDVTPESLHDAADKVITGVNAMVETLTEQRPPTLSPGTQCNWCPVSDQCPVAGLAPEKAAALAAEGPVRLGMPAVREPATH